MRAATTAPRTPATGPAAPLSEVVLGAEVWLPPPPPTKAVEVRVTTEREPETVLLETPPVGLEVGIEAPPEAAVEAGALESAADV